MGLKTWRILVGQKKDPLLVVFYDQKTLHPTKIMGRIAYPTKKQKKYDNFANRWFCVNVSKCATHVSRICWKCAGIVAKSCDMSALKIQSGTLCGFFKFTIFSFFFAPN